MRISSPKSIRDVISSTLQRLGHSKKIKQCEVVDVWPSIVGEQISKIATAERMEHGKLFVKVSRSTWRNELIFLKQELIERINKTMDQEIVQDIIFK